jgi:hypothetical protein
MKRALIGISLLLVVAATARLIPGRAQEASGQPPAGTVAPPSNSASNAAKEKVLLAFPGGKKGGDPSAKLVFDSAGNLYGMTEEGGGKDPNCPFSWCGAAFELTPTSSGKWKERVLHDFTANKGGVVPTADPILDSAGNVYGATMRGGVFGAGVVFKLTRTASGKWKENVLYSFAGGKDGGLPGPLIFDQAGNLYGTADQGNGQGCGGFGCGLVFKLTPTANGKWKESVLHAFTGGSDGGNPSGLIFDAAGNLYGTTVDGGGGNCGGVGCGVVFELMPRSDGKWREKVLHAFTSPGDGALPYGGVMFDASGSLYGTTNWGGDWGSCQGFGCGVVFKLMPTSDGRWKETLLHTFTGGKDGAGPYGGVIFDAAGNLYSTAYVGGITNCFGGGYGCGVVFKLTPTSSGEWKEIVLHTFTGGNDGGNPQSGLIFDAKGDLYGSTEWGGRDGWGVIFELIP